MTRVAELEPRFVRVLPESLPEGVLFISIEYAIAGHRCCCGCGSEVFTPFSPVDWALTFNGESVSLDPSIGNWSFKCRSHYWVASRRVCRS